MGFIVRDVCIVHVVPIVTTTVFFVTPSIILVVPPLVPIVFPFVVTKLEQTLVSVLQEPADDQTIKQSSGQTRAE